MALIQVLISVNTTNLLNAYPNGSTTPISSPSTYIHMTIVEGASSCTNVTGSGGAELGFTAARNSDLRFIGKSTDEYGDVYIVESGALIPTNCIVGGAFFFDGGAATAKTVNNTAAQQAYNFVIRVDDFHFTFVWDPFLSVV